MLINAFLLPWHTFNLDDFFVLIYILSFEVVLYTSYGILADADSVVTIGTSRYKDKIPYIPALYLSFFLFYKLHFFECMKRIK